MHTNVCVHVCVAGKPESEVDLLAGEHNHSRRCIRKLSVFGGPFQVYHKPKNTVRAVLHLHLERWLVDWWMGIRGGGGTRLTAMLEGLKHDSRPRIFRQVCTAVRKRERQARVQKVRQQSEKLTTLQALQLSRCAEQLF